MGMRSNIMQPVQIACHVIETQNSITVVIIPRKIQD
jgi:hypothetical protein